MAGMKRKEDVVPFIKYLLGTVLAAYKEFEDRFAIIGVKRPAIEMVRKATENKIGKFCKTRYQRTLSIT